MEDSSEAAKRIEQAHTRLSREEALRDLLGTKDSRMQAMEDAMKDTLGEGDYRLQAADLVRAVYNEPTKVGRSESLVSEEARQELADKVDLVRTWMWEHGRPPHGEEIEFTEESGHVVIDDRFYFAVEEEGEPKYPEIAIAPVRLYAEEDDPERRVTIKSSFGYDGRYHLEMFYYRGSNKHRKPSTSYSSALRPFEQVAENEAVIMHGVLDDFIVQHQIEKLPSSPTNNPQL